jgi:hypothetical protein
MAVFDFLARLLGKGPRPLPTRLSSDQAIAIARSAAADDPDRDLLTITTVERRSGKAIWIVSPASMGRRLVISIDDATGEVLDKQHLGVR